MSPAEPGRRLLAAVAVMDRLRSPGGCPWDAEQTHASLRRYLVEECYELLDALAAGTRADVVEELGDVLLQVLFHARIGAEAPDGFTIDDVADALVAKLVHRHPHVFAATGTITVSDQEQRWEELKSAEKRRPSAVDGVALAQPALALGAKLASRAGRAGVPVELLPAELRVLDGDAEDALRGVAVGFASSVRAAEAAARAAGLDPAHLAPAQWRAHWPSPPPPPPPPLGVCAQSADRTAIFRRSVRTTRVGWVVSGPPVPSGPELRPRRGCSSPRR